MSSVQLEEFSTGWHFSPLLLLQRPRFRRKSLSEWLQTNADKYSLSQGRRECYDDDDDGVDGDDDDAIVVCLNLCQRAKTFPSQTEHNRTNGEDFWSILKIENFVSALVSALIAPLSALENDRNDNGVV